MNPMVARAATLNGLLLWLAVSGCRGESAPPGGFEVITEDGIEIILNRTPEYPVGAWTVSVEPEVTIGEIDGDEPYLLRRVIHAHTLADGRIVVVDAGAPAVREFSPMGIHLRSQGRQGQGPGEYQNILSSKRVHGAALILHEFPARYTFLTEDGEFLRNWTSSLPSPSHFLADGNYVWVVEETAARSGQQVLSRTFIRGTAEGIGTDTLLIMPGREVFRMQHQNGVSIVPIPFGDPPVYVLDSADSGRIVGSGEGYELVFHSMSGEVTRKARLPQPPVSVAEADWESAVQRQVEGVTASFGNLPIELRTSRARSTQEALTQARAPDYRPGFDEILADQSAFVWAREYQEPGEQSNVRTWAVFNRHGRWATSVRMPSSLDILEIGETHLLVRSTDDLGIQRVERYGLQRE